jgi:hypothetical protein
MSAAKEGAMNQSNIMLYGATGFSGGLIAAEGKANGMSNEGAGDCRMTLAARDGARLRAVAEKNAMDFRVFGLDDRSEVRKHLDGVAVVINAAGPLPLQRNRWRSRPGSSKSTTKPRQRRQNPFHPSRSAEGRCATRKDGSARSKLRAGSATLTRRRRIG